MKNIHEPNMRTITMVEKAILDSVDYPTKTALWRRLPRQIQFQTYSRVLEYLDAHGLIAFNGNTIIYTGVNNEKLKRLLATSTQVR